MKKDWFIQPIPPEKATGKLAGIYEKISGPGGQVAHILQCSGANAPATEAHLNLYKAIMFRPSPLSRCEREMLAVAVSWSNHCHY